MNDNFPDGLKESLQTAIMAALALEDMDVGEGAVAVVSSPMFGEAEIPLG